MTDIIGLSGKQGAGKTTLREYLRKNYRELGYDYFQNYKFADTLYELHEVILNMMQVRTGKPRKDKDGLLLQVLGTEWGRKEFGANIWVHILMQRVHTYENLMRGANTRALIVIDDMRFFNEFEALSDGLRVRLKASEECRKKRAHGWRDNVNHPSEIDLDFADESGQFDLYLDTENKTPQMLVQEIKNKLETSAWRHRTKLAGGNNAVV
jgi:dephospho-CoA kinase